MLHPPERVGKPGAESRVASQHGSPKRDRSGPRLGLCIASRIRTMVMRSTGEIRGVARPSGGSWGILVDARSEMGVTCGRE